MRKIKNLYGTLQAIPYEIDTTGKKIGLNSLYWKKHNEFTDILRNFIIHEWDAGKASANDIRFMAMLVNKFRPIALHNFLAKLYPSPINPQQ